MTTNNKDTADAGTIGEIIRNLRLAADMTPEQLGTAAQVSPSYIRKPEGGLRQDITLDTAKKLATGLGVAPGIFFEAEPHRASQVLVPSPDVQPADQLLQWATSLQTGVSALLEELERLHLLADAAYEAIVVLEKGKVLFVNRTLLDMIDLPGDPNQLVGFDVMDVNNLARFVSTESVAAAHYSLETLTDTPPAPFTLQRVDGSHLQVWARGKIMQYGGRPVLVVILRDTAWEDAY